MSGKLVNDRTVDIDLMMETLADAGFEVPPGRQTAVARSGVGVVGWRVSRAAALTEWRRLLAAREHTGMHPVLTDLDPARLVAGEPGDPDVFDDRAVTAPREIVAEVTAAVLADRLANAEDDEERRGWREDFDPEQLAVQVSSVPDPPATIESTGSWLCLVGTPTGWSVPGLVPGRPYAPNWFVGPENRGMRDSDHAAFLHTWNDRFGAELRFVTDTMLVLDVARPPQDPLEVAEAAIEQYAYCPDGHDTTAYADGQTRTGTWQFTWD
ncbi:DUF4253 domain-containing protein [Streptomyces sp. NPDC012888]|uniref:DUF4253 domain-containing protein n=1 Tax=Streptomyces sp. NPDC012888 TaxID=3364855 RepID=UPI00368F7278